MRRRNKGLRKLAQSQTNYALEALQHVFARMPWGETITFSDGRKGQIHPFVEPRWTRSKKTTDLVEGGFDVKFLDGGHLEFFVHQSGWGGSMRAANPQARAEYRDLVTGELVRPGTPGSMATGKYVMRIRPEPGMPMETIEVDREDLDPAKDTYGVAKETYPRYRDIAAAQAKAKARELKRMPTFSRGQELRIPGARATFSSAKSAADQFLSYNPSLWALGWADVGDYVEDWMDRTEVRVRGRRFAALNRTRRGQELLDLFRRGQNDAGMKQMLAYLFGQARGRRWDDVPWDKVDSLVEIFAEAARREADRIGDSDFLTAGVPHIAWLPPAMGGAPTPEFVQSLTLKGQEYFQRHEASQRLYDLADRLDGLLRANRKCLSAEDRKVVRQRIKTIRGWAQRPDTMPEWACASFQEPAQLCDLLGIEAEVSKLAAACEFGYDPAWAKRGGDTVQPGLGVIPEAAEFAAPEDDLDLPWETAANPARRRRHRRR